MIKISTLFLATLAFTAINSSFASAALQPSQLVFPTVVDAAFHAALSTAVAYATYKAALLCNAALRTVAQKPMIDKMSEKDALQALVNYQPNYGGLIGWGIVTAIGGYHALDFARDAIARLEIALLYATAPTAST